MDPLDLLDLEEKREEMAVMEWMEYKDPLAMFSSFQQTSDLTRGLITNSSQSSLKPCRI